MVVLLLFVLGEFAVCTLFFFIDFIVNEIVGMFTGCVYKMAENGSFVDKPNILVLGGKNEF